MVPTFLQMRWIESPPYFYTASAVGWDVAAAYISKLIGSFQHHKFGPITETDPVFQELSKTVKNDSPMLPHYLLDIYWENYIICEIGLSQEQLCHVITAIMTGIHNVSPTKADHMQD